jgi:DNA-binding NarL/FixJ family response regulator
VDAGAVRQATDREREVLALVGGRLSNDEIAARLVISTATAPTHVSLIMTKVGARDRRLARRARLRIRPGESPASLIPRG